MNDLISRQEALKTYQDIVCKGICCADCRAVDRDRNCVVEDWLKALPPANQWIPCSEGLPEDGERVIVQYGDGSLEVIERVRLKIWNLINSPYAKVVAWTPAPEPWEGDK